MERFYDDLAVRDAFYDRYGWTSAELDATPQREIDHLPAVWAAKAAVRERARARAETAAKAQAMATKR